MTLTSVITIATINQDQLGTPVGSLTLVAGEVARRRRERRSDYSRSLQPESAIALTATAQPEEVTQHDAPTHALLQNSSHSPSETTTAGQRFHEVHYPPIPVATPVSPTIARVPHRLRGVGSAPILRSRPLSDGPMGHTYTPLATRRSGFESFLPYERYPRQRRSILSLAGAVCDLNEGTTGRVAREVFLYTPDGEHAIAIEKKPRWYKKGAIKVKKFFKKA